jgi:hypothetical protein
LLQAGGEHFHGEAFRHLRLRPFGRRDHFGHVLEIRRLGIVLGMAGRWQVVRRDVPANARRIGFPGAEGIGAGTYLLTLCRCKKERERKAQKDR